MKYVRVWVTVLTGLLLPSVFAETQSLNPISSNIRPVSGQFRLQNPGDTITYQILQSGRTVPFSKVIIAANTDAPAWNVSINGVNRLVTRAQFAANAELPLSPNGDSQVQFMFPGEGISIENSLEIRLVSASTDPLVNPPPLVTTPVSVPASTTTTPLLTTRSVLIPSTFTRPLSRSIIASTDSRVPVSLTDTGLSLPTLQPPPASTYDTNRPTGVPDVLASTRSDSGKIAGVILGTLFGCALIVTGLCCWRRRNRNRRVANKSFMNYSGGGGDVDQRYPYAPNYYATTGDNSGAVATSPKYPGPGQRNATRAVTFGTGGMSPVVEEKIQDPFEGGGKEGPYPAWPGAGGSGIAVGSNRPPGDMV